MPGDCHQLQGRASPPGLSWEPPGDDPGVGALWGWTEAGRLRKAEGKGKLCIGIGLKP